MKKNQDDNNKKRQKNINWFNNIIYDINCGYNMYYILIKNKDDKKDTELAYTDLIKQMSDGKVEKVEMTVGSTSIKVKNKR